MLLAIAKATCRGHRHGLVGYSGAVGTEVDWHDVARFVGAYMDGRRSGLRSRALPSGNLLDEIADAYLEYRELPASVRAEVLAMVDSVL